MVTFKNFLHLISLNEEGLSSNDKGVLHEHLVGRELNRIWGANAEHRTPYVSCCKRAA